MAPSQDEWSATKRRDGERRARRPFAEVVLPPSRDPIGRRVARWATRSLLAAVSLGIVALIVTRPHRPARPAPATAAAQPAPTGRRLPSPPERPRSNQRPTSSPTSPRAGAGRPASPTALRLVDVGDGQTIRVEQFAYDGRWPARDTVVRMLPDGQRVVGVRRGAVLQMVTGRMAADALLMLSEDVRRRLAPR